MDVIQMLDKRIAEYFKSVSDYKTVVKNLVSAAIIEAGLKPSELKEDTQYCGFIEPYTCGLRCIGNQTVIRVRQDAPTNYDGEFISNFSVFTEEGYFRGCLVDANLRNQIAVCLMKYPIPHADIKEVLDYFWSGKTIKLYDHKTFEQCQEQ